MDYSSQARSRIETGDVILFSGGSLTARLIRIFTQSAYSHVAIAVRVEGRVMLAESFEGAGVRVRPLSQVKRFFVLRAERDFTPEARAWVWSKMGARYDWRAILANIFQGRIVRDGRYICSEFVGEAWAQAGHPFSPAGDWRNPKALADAMGREGAVLWQVNNEPRVSPRLPRKRWAWVCHLFSDTTARHGQAA